MISIIVTLLIFTTSIVSFAQQDIRIMVDSVLIDDANMIIENGVSCLSLEFIKNSLNVNVDILHEGEEIQLTKGDTILKLISEEATINKNISESNGEIRVISTSIKTLGDTTFVSLRPVLEGLDYIVNWDNDTRTIIINNMDWMESFYVMNQIAKYETDKKKALAQKSNPESHWSKKTEEEIKAHFDDFINYTLSNAGPIGENIPWADLSPDEEKLMVEKLSILVSKDINEINFKIHNLIDNTTISGSCSININEITKKAKTDGVPIYDGRPYFNVFTTDNTGEDWSYFYPPWVRYNHFDSHKAYDLNDILYDNLFYQVVNIHTSIIHFDRMNISNKTPNNTMFIDFQGVRYIYTYSVDENGVMNIILNKGSN